MGEAARARAEAMFSIEAVVNAHLSIYRRVAATTPRAS
jgi:glycosyltransferase involved in cell wall biosynthesis